MPRVLRVVSSLASDWIGDLFPGVRLFLSGGSTADPSIFGNKGRQEMAAFGHVSKFNTSVEEWVVYTERLNHYFVTNDIVDGVKKRAILLSMCGPTTYGLIRSLVSRGLANSNLTYVVGFQWFYAHPVVASYTMHGHGQSSPRIQVDGYCTQLFCHRPLCIGNSCLCVGWDSSWQ